jgi:hypothetical protein
MKAILLKQNNVVKIAYPDSYIVVFGNEGLFVNGVLNKEYKRSIYKVVNTTDLPTAIYSEMYEWKDSQWVMLAGVNNVVERIYAICEKLTSVQDPQVPSDEWQEYVNRINTFKDSILETVNPMYVNLKNYIVPGIINLWELRSVLSSEGLLDDVEAIINTLPESTKLAALEAWNHASTIRRYSPTIKLIQQGLGLSTYQVDEIFRKAKTIDL